MVSRSKRPYCFCCSKYPFRDQSEGKGLARVEEREHESEADIEQIRYDEWVASMLADMDQGDLDDALGSSVEFRRFT